MSKLKPSPPPQHSSLILRVPRDMPATCLDVKNRTSSATYHACHRSLRFPQVKLIPVLFFFSVPGPLSPSTLL
eukprot:749598-Hanusia_phi.AAC.1